MDTEIFKEINNQLKHGQGDFIQLQNQSMPKFSKRVVTKLQKIPGLNSLMISSCKLNCLKLFPDLPNLICLDLSENLFAGKELKELAKLESLESLNLSGNQIKSYEELQPLTQLRCLVDLDLSHTPLSKEAYYRAKVFEMFKGLVILDRMDNEGLPYAYSDQSDDQAFDDIEFEDSLRSELFHRGMIGDLENYVENGNGNRNADRQNQNEESEDEEEEDISHDREEINPDDLISFLEKIETEQEEGEEDEDEEEEDEDEYADFYFSEGSNDDEDEDDDEDDEDEDDEDEEEDDDDEDEKRNEDDIFKPSLRKRER